MAGPAASGGCPPPKPKLVAVTNQRIELLEKIYFVQSKADLLERSHNVLLEVTRILKVYPKVSVLIEGHTDNAGSERSNLVLSDARSRSVRAFLIKQGVAGERLTTLGLGESQPIDTNETRQGRANNRRVEFKIKAGPRNLKHKDTRATSETLESTTP